MSVKYQSFENLIKHRGPREKMLEFGPTALKDYELLAVIFGTGYMDENVLELSQRVLADYGSKAILKAKSVGEVQETVGLPVVKSCQLLALLELGKRFFAPDFSDYPVIRLPADAYKIFKLMGKNKKEVLEGIYLNARNRVIHHEVISVGTITKTIMSPAEIFRPALKCNAVAVIIAHNHLAGDTTPSEDDLKNTLMLQKIGEQLECKLLDHLIIGKGKFRSILQP